ncbi:MAG TPA: histidine phosphatase family protein [Thermoanaerobaculia bacterium]|nr:histidine phosphatase family protein [Thermoanaerobaculia bacterium]
MKRPIALLLLVALPLIAHAETITTAIVVRHADRANITQNSPLSGLGLARAAELARVLASVKLDAIYATQYVRTQQTVAPTAKEKGLTPVIFEAGREAALAADVREHHAGGTVLIASHSDRIPELLRQLGVVDPPSLSMTEYDDLFIVTNGKLLTLRYGATAR